MESQSKPGARPWAGESTSLIPGGVLEFVPANAHPERFGQSGELHDLLNRLHWLEIELPLGEEVVAVEHFKLIAQWRAGEMRITRRSPSR